MPTTPPVMQHLDADAVRRWIALSLTTAQNMRDLIDSFNVFPIPDSDTGTNVLLTLQSANSYLEATPNDADLAQVSTALADGAVRGARGNSGLLVSQAMTALAEVAADAPAAHGLRPVELVHAYEQMAASSWSAVSHPVDGTLLTVLQDAARAARESLDASTVIAPVTLADVAATAAFSAQESVVETGGLGHGPVDAGGAAIMLLLTCLADVIATDTDGALAPIACQMLEDLSQGARTHLELGSTLGPLSTGEFEVMYLLEATPEQAGQVRNRLEEIGDSVGVVGTSDAWGVGLYQVHVHTDTPRAALPLQGKARQICVHHLHSTPLISEPTDEPPELWGSQGQDSHVVSFDRFAAALAAKQAQRENSTELLLPEKKVGVIACTRAPGLIAQLGRTGSVVVLDAASDGIVRAVGDLGLSDVLVLPCDAESSAQAHAAARTLAKRAAATSLPSSPDADLELRVADTDDDAQVLAAAVALAARPEAAGDTLTDLVRQVRRATAILRTYAFTGHDAESQSVAQAISESLRHDDQRVTVILGQNASTDVSEMVRETVNMFSAEIEVAINAGMQVSPDVLVAVE